MSVIGMCKGVFVCFLAFPIVRCSIKLRFFGFTFDVAETKLAPENGGYMKNPIGIYEKALPKNLSWAERFKAAREAG